MAKKITKKAETKNFAQKVKEQLTEHQTRKKIEDIHEQRTFEKLFEI
ncbi:hypothetical protein [Vibrio albus]|nr:hypothetical protein [Vibrio albus]